MPAGLGWLSKEEVRKGLTLMVRVLRRYRRVLEVNPKRCGMKMSFHLV